MEKRSGRHRQSPSKKTDSRLLSLFLLTVFTLLSAYLTFLIFAYNFLEFRYVNLLVIGSLVVVFVLSLGLIVAGRGKWLSRFLLIVSSILVGVGIFVAHSAINFSNTLNQTASFSQVEMSIVVAKDSPLTAVEQVTQLLAPANDAENTGKLQEDLTQNKQLTPQIESVDSYQAAYEAILSDGNKAMMLNSAYVSLLEATDPDFTNKVKTIYTMTVKKEVASQTPVTNGDSFNIYISGIDSYGPISGVSRSDVNIIMTVNRKTHKVLLTTTPRDSYVAIAGGGNNQYDKLTHAGIYGVESSIQTLENLYGIDISYYARLNFTSFVKMIDMVGGVEVYNDQEFTSLHGNYHFPVGNVSLNSEQALGFVRERYSLQNGDADRGRNQMKVITALVKKLASLNSLANYTSLIDQLGGSIQTDMPLSVMMDLANTQLQDKNTYQVSTQALTGTGSTGELPSYAMPSSALYMLSIDESSLASAKQAIADVMEGR